MEVAFGLDKAMRLCIDSFSFNPFICTRFALPSVETIESDAEIEIKKLEKLLPKARDLLVSAGISPSIRQHGWRLGNESHRMARLLRGL